MNNYPILICIAFGALAAGFAFVVIRLGRVSEELRKSREEMKSVSTLMEAQKDLNASQDRAINSLNVQMTEINKGIGQVTSVTSSVESLNKVLTKVKTRGILGEYRAEGILREVLADNQYEKNFDAAGQGKGTVEFVIKVPGEDGTTVYLPVDSKFPLDTYQNYVEAREGADRARIEKTRNALKRRLEDEAKDISDKYIAPPRTTAYALMFLPVESLYFEVLDDGLFEKLQREYSVIAVGPTSLSAMLSSIESGYRAIALEAHSDEVWKTLAAVKTEMMRFSDDLGKAKRNLAAAENAIDSLIGPRTNVMMKKLDEVTELSEEESEQMFGSEERDELQINTYGDNGE
ncbi:MAG: DNA recombination protein RmuC [Eubacterium sp.]|nr:DNA recombination protein RmuC [Eubacterium sp.]